MSKPSISVTAPVAPIIPTTLTQHGHTRIDNYYWMRDDQRNDKAVLEHLRAENSYCDQSLLSQKPLEEQLFDELKSRIVKDDSTVPVKDGAYWYFSTVTGEDEFARYYRADTFSGDNKTLMLNVNLLAEQHEYFDLGDLSTSPNDELLVYTQDIEGRQIYSARFKCLTTDKYLPDVIENIEGQIVWANDNQTIFYVKKDLQTLLGFEVYRHQLGTDQSDDVLVYQEQDDSFYISLGKSRDESLIFIDLEATQTSDSWVINANEPEATFKQLIPREEAHEFDINKLGDTYYITTNWQAKNFKLMTANQSTIGDKALWQDLIPHRENVLFEEVELFNNFMVVTEREQGQIRFVVYNHQGKPFTLAFDDPCYAAGIANNPEPDSNTARIYYSSLTTPGSLFEFDLTTGERTLLKQQKVLGEFNAKNYDSERLFIPGRDGVKIPVSLVYHKEKFKKDGTNPLLQYGYGSYGITIDPSFSSDVVSLLDRGFIYVIAHVRGSEMLGRAWYEAGKMQYKQNTFNDFIDVTKALIAQGYGAEDKIFASGGSAGGLLMGAVVNQAPELYNGIGCHVPFLDVVTTMLDESIPLTTNEYDEWGNPTNKDDYDTMLAYSPIDNIKAQPYPNILVTTGLHDSQVQYWEPMKWVAKLRAVKTDENILVLKTDMDAGHGGASGRFKSLKEKAVEMAFFITLANK